MDSAGSCVFSSSRTGPANSNKRSRFNIPREGPSRRRLKAKAPPEFVSIVTANDEQWGADAEAAMVMFGMGADEETRVDAYGRGQRMP